MATTRTAQAHWEGSLFKTPGTDAHGAMGEPAVTR